MALTAADGSLLSQQRYLPFGGTREMPGAPLLDHTDLTYTGQRSLEELGLMDYKARFYDPSLGRFLQPDTLLPGAGNPQNWNRFSYVGNSPISFNDPTGHMRDSEDRGSKRGCTHPVYCRDDDEPDPPLSGDDGSAGGGGSDDSDLCELAHGNDHSCIDGTLDDAQAVALANTLLTQSKTARNIKTMFYVAAGAAAIVGILAFVALTIVSGGGSLALILAMGGLTASAAPALAAVVTVAGFAASAAGLGASVFDVQQSKLADASSALSNNNDGSTQIAAYDDGKIDILGKGVVEGLPVPQPGFDSILGFLNP